MTDINLNFFDKFFEWLIKIQEDSHRDRMWQLRHFTLQQRLRLIKARRYENQYLPEYYQLEAETYRDLHVDDVFQEVNEKITKFEKKINQRKSLVKK